ncbi:hypothetical protein ES703_92627 [subsurface metagenome]
MLGFVLVAVIETKAEIDSQLPFDYAVLGKGRETAGIVVSFHHSRLETIRAEIEAAFSFGCGIVIGISCIKVHPPCPPGVAIHKPVPHVYGVFELGSNLHFMACSQEVILESGRRNRSQRFCTDIIVKIGTGSPINFLFLVIGAVIPGVFGSGENWEMAMEISSSDIQKGILIQNPVKLMGGGIGVFIVPNSGASETCVISSPIEINRFVVMVVVEHAHVSDVLGELES